VTTAITATEFMKNLQVNSAHTVTRWLLALVCASAQCRAAVPVAQPDSVTMHHSQKVGIAILANDSGAVSAIVAQPPQFGTATPDSNGRILYCHTGGLPDEDSFTYRAVNADGVSPPVRVTIRFSGKLRISNRSLNVPASPPATDYQIVNAFGSLAFEQPVCMATPPGETKRLFVCEKGGKIMVVHNVTSETPKTSTFLDLAKLLASRGESISDNGEEGLLGLAFHPDHSENRQFFVFYSVDKNASNPSPIFERISRFTTRAGDPNKVDPNSERILIEQEDQAGNHNGGDLHFGPDGYLYVSLGDEGAQNDALQNSQRLTRDFFSAILRIDVDKKPGNLEPNAHPHPLQSIPATNAVKRYETAPGSGVFLAAYSIPVDNPFVASSAGGDWDGTFNGVPIPSADLPYVRSEFWAVGLRNPWRMSFDPPTGGLWVGDVGGDEREEIDVVVRKQNYGWTYREGFIAGPGAGEQPSGFQGTDPVYDYPHVGPGDFSGNAVIGGIIYRGSRFGNLAGAYVFADHSSGNIWTLRRDGNGPATVERIAGESGVSAFGKDPSNGDVLMANLSSNRIRRLIANPTNHDFPTQLSATGLFADLTDLSPNPGLLPYQVNLPFWSDHAVKRRWFIIPDSSGKMKWSRDREWEFPNGQIWVKHFDLPLVRSNPPQATDSPTPSKRVETRILVKTATGSYGVSYRWNLSGTDATLVADEGDDFSINVTRNGSAYQQSWRIPSRAECATCHTPQAGHSLSMNTRQINLTSPINGFSGNQLSILRDGGYFSNEVDSPNVLPRHIGPDETAFPVQARARSYLAVNCAYCHQRGGTASPANWDGRTGISLSRSGLINGNASNNQGDPLNRLVVPGDPSHSVIYHRVANANGFTRMPPLATSELDHRSIDLLAEWITEIPATAPAIGNARLTAFNALPPVDGTTPDHPLPNIQRMALAPITGFGSVRLSFHPPAGGSGQVEVSSNLADWKPWDVPGNDGLPKEHGTVTLEGQAEGSCQFFRLKIEDD
jgi:uncharacterized repeat protein (TIGR03806 family)